MSLLAPLISKAQGLAGLHGLGAIPQAPDSRDIPYRASFAAPLPTLVDLRPLMPPVYSQGRLGSCTANSTGGAVQYQRRLQKEPDWVPSRLFIYYNTRALEGNVNGSGGTNRDAFKAVHNQGACPETEWPYDPTQVKVKPSAQCYIDGAKYKALTYLSLANSDITSLKTCLAQGYPFVIGVLLYSGFEGWKTSHTGVVAMPGMTDKFLGRHSMLAVGYSDTDQQFIVRNSWGKWFGDQGYVYMPYPYLTNTTLAFDFWTMRSES